MKNKKLLMIFPIILIMLIITGCKSENAQTTIKEDLLNINYKEDTNELELPQYETQNPVVAMYI